MVKLAILLMGADAMQRRWLALALIGVVWAGLGVLIMADASDGVTVVATETFGYLLVIEGLAAFLATIVDVVSGGRLLLIRALALIAFGLLIIDMPWRNDIANSLLFGLAFLIDGIVRVAAALVLRQPRWKMIMLGGAVELVLAVLALSEWPISYEKTVPFCIGVALLLSGVTVLRIGLMLRRLSSNMSVTDLPLFTQSGWHLKRGPGVGVAAIVEAPERPLTIRVWTPTGSAKDPARRPLIDRYLAAVDSKGVISTGHAALSLPPDLYISHYPATEFDRSRRDFARALRATAENDVPGRFLASYDTEVAGWCEADANVAFHRYNAEQLQAFWQAYRASDTYNLTNRNCSIAVAVALDAALEGVLAKRAGWFAFIRLLSNPDLWLAALLRARAEAVTWTPGLVLDYARALRRVVEPRRVSWLSRMVHSVRRYWANRPPSQASAT